MTSQIRKKRPTRSRLASLPTESSNQYRSGFVFIGQYVEYCQQIGWQSCEKRSWISGYASHNSYSSSQIWPTIQPIAWQVTNMTDHSSNSRTGKKFEQLFNTIAGQVTNRTNHSANSRTQIWPTISTNRRTHGNFTKKLGDRYVCLHELNFDNR